MRIKKLPKELRIPKKNCKLCHLHKTRKNVCPGTGPGAASPIVFCGEAPGAQENASGIVFCGRAGHHLNKVLKMFKVPRNYVTVLNIISCQPPKNRDPSPKEVAACIPFFHRKIKIIKPELIVALGKVPFLYLTGYRYSVVDSHGVMQPYTEDNSLDVLLTFHPSFIIRPFGSKYNRSFVKDINSALKFCDLK